MRVLPEYVTINGTRYATANLTDAAKAQVLNIQIAEQEIGRLQQRLALAQTARNAYVSGLLGALKPADVEPEGKLKKARGARKSKKAEEA
jgi:hypothetical protein